MTYELLFVPITEGEGRSILRRFHGHRSQCNRINWISNKGTATES